MQLEKMAAVVRPRRPWEAVDLGFCMARAWWPATMRAWLGVVVPFYVVVAALLYEYPNQALMLLWWLKPLYDRVPLYVLSRALFGEVPRAREVRGKMPRLWLSRCLGVLTYRRLDPMRSFLAPIDLLEGPRASLAERRQRATVLRRGEGEGEAASWLTFACLLFESGTLLALIGLLDMLRPETVEPSFWELLALSGDGLAPVWYPYLTLALYLVAMSLIEPFYVAGGFALYLNRRTQLEGWDVELAFRRLSRRLRARRPARSIPKAAAVALLVAGGALAWPADAQEVLPERDPQEAVAEILADPEFGTEETVRTWRPKFLPEETPDESRSSSFLQAAVTFLGGFMEILLWGALLIAAGALVGAALARLWRPRRPEEPPPEDAPAVLCGLDVSPEALPADIVAAALAQWREGRAEEALRLLYRGALSRLVDRRQLPVEDSWTEGDCLRHLRRETNGSTPLVDYFTGLTRTWLRTAYAERPPREDEMRELTDDWPIHFGTTPS